MAQGTLEGIKGREPFENIKFKNFLIAKLDEAAREIGLPELPGASSSHNYYFYPYRLPHQALHLQATRQFTIGNTTESQKVDFTFEDDPMYGQSMLADELGRKFILIGGNTFMPQIEYLNDIAVQRAAQAN